MKLRTSCRGCNFIIHEENLKEPKCNANRDVFYENKECFTEGFCNIKGHKTIDLHDIKTKESKLSILLLAKDAKYCRVIDFINTVCNHCDQIVISSFNGTQDYLEKITKTLKSRDIQWHIDNAYVDPDIEYQDHTIVDAVVKHVNNHWFIVLTPQDVLKAHSITKLKEILKNNDSNHVCYYFDDLRIMTSKAAFQQLKGNQQKPYLEKLKEFDNWESKCTKME